MSRNTARMTYNLSVSGGRSRVGLLRAFISTVGVIVSFAFSISLFVVTVVSAIIIIMARAVVSIVELAIITTIVISIVRVSVSSIRIISVVLKIRFSLRAARAIPRVLLSLESVLHSVRVRYYVAVISKKVFLLDLVKHVFFTSLEAFSLKFVPRLGVGFIFNGNPGGVKPSVVLT